MIAEQEWIERARPGRHWLPLAAECMREVEASAEGVPHGDPLLGSFPEESLQAALRERALGCLERLRLDDLDRLLTLLEEGAVADRQWAARLRSLLSDPAHELPGLLGSSGNQPGAWRERLSRALEIPELLAAGRFRSAEALAHRLEQQVAGQRGDARVLLLILRAIPLLLMGKAPELARVVAEASACQSAEAPLGTLLQTLAEEGAPRLEHGRLARRLLVESYRHGAMLGRSPAFQSMLARLSRAAHHGDPVLLSGESGTGKELAARYLHEHSPRSGAAMVCLNCAGLPLSLAESELFGCTAGAFTGARERRGLVERAEGGTLFLDEFGAMPPGLQAKLLRLLESGEYYRVGDSRPRQAHFRLVAATNEESRLLDNGFRQDLLFRMGGEPLRLPALRERLEDLPLLCQAFLLELPDGDGAQDLCSAESQSLLAAWSWPGNIRELRFRLRQLVRMSRQERRQALERLCRPIGTDRPTMVAEQPELRAITERAERQAVADALRRHPGDKRQAARELGISLPTLYSRLKRWQESPEPLQLNS